MNKRMRELQALMLQKSKEVDGYMVEGEGRDLAKAEAALNELDALQKEFELEERAEKAKKAGVPSEPEQKPAEKVDAVKAFADAARARFKDLNEGTPADGGYTVPEDISTKINEYKQERFSLLSLIDVENVGTKSGRRTYKKRSQHTGFSEVGEGGKIGKTAAPQFEVLAYNIKKYAGYMPVTNELLADSDAAITNMMVEWLGEEEIATDNAKILAAVNTVDATPMSKMADLKKAVNVTLAAFAGSVRIVTNSNGLQWMDTLEDGNGRPLLAPNPADAMELRLAIGTRHIPVTVVPNDVMPNTEGGAIPFIVGDLREFMKKFNRNVLTLMTSNVAAIGDLNAYEQDLTLIRAIMRADYVVKDSAAIVRGELVPKA